MPSSSSMLPRFAFVFFCVKKSVLKYFLGFFCMQRILSSLFFIRAVCSKPGCGPPLSGNKFFAAEPGWTGNHIKPQKKVFFGSFLGGFHFQVFSEKSNSFGVGVFACFLGGFLPGAAWQVQWARVAFISAVVCFKECTLSGRNNLFFCVNLLR